MQIINSQIHAAVSEKLVIGSWEDLRLYCCPKATGKKIFKIRQLLEMCPLIKSLSDTW